MSSRWPYLAVVALLMAFPACKKPASQQPVVVHVFRDLHSPYAHELDHRILEFQSSNPRLPSGAPVVIESINELDYKAALTNNFDKNVKTEIVVLNSATDITEVPALIGQLAKAVNVCAAVKACPATVPAFITADATGDRIAGAQVFLNYLGQQKQEVAPPPQQSTPAQATPAQNAPGQAAPPADAKGKTN